MSWRRRFWSSASAATALAYSTAVFAQDQDAAGSGDRASWAFSYLLVGLLAALGLMAVCRPGNRSSEIKRQDDDEE